MPKTATKPHSRYRRGSSNRPKDHHRRLQCEMLENRLLLSVVVDGPRVIAHMPQGVLGNPVTAVDVKFNEMIDQNSVTQWDVGVVDLDLNNPAAMMTEEGNYNINVLPGYDSVSNCTIVGDYLYAATSKGLQVLDISSPSSPTLVPNGTYDTQGWAYGVTVVNGRAYVADYENGLQILDVSGTPDPDKSWIRSLGSYNTPGQARDVKIVDTLDVNTLAVKTFAYVADGESGLQILDVTTSASPFLVGSYNTPGQACNVEIVDGLAYVADREGGLQIINVSTPSAPTLVGSFATADDAQDLTVVNGRAYVAIGYGGLQILDVSKVKASNPNPVPNVITSLGIYQDPTLNPTDNRPGFAMGATVVGNLAFVAYGAKGLQILDISDPATITALGIYDAPDLQDWSCDDVSVDGGLVYVADDTGGMQVLKFGSAIDRPSLSRLSDTEYRIQYTVPDPSHHYALIVGPDIMDLGSHRMDQDKDGMDGGGGKDAYYAEFFGTMGLVPTNIELPTATIAESEPENTFIGTFSTTDLDSGAFTYMLVDETGATDNASFSIVGNNLYSAAVFDCETKSVYTIRVRSTDPGGLYFEKNFTIHVTDVNERPTDIAITNTVVVENQSSTIAIGTFSTTDPDAGNTFTYGFATGTGDTDNALFIINGTTLKAKDTTTFDYDTKSSYSILVRSMDQGWLYKDKAILITVTNVNEPPTDITLTGSTVAENITTVTTVGTLSTTDPDAGNTFTYSLVSGTGGEDNASFTISGSTVRTAASAVFDLETKSSYSILVCSMDQGGEVKNKALTISLTNVNEAPTDITPSSFSMAESATTVGTLFTTDPDAGNTFNYTLVSGTGSTNNASFTIVGSTLQATAPLDYETQKSYSVRVRSTDQGGVLYTEKAITIGVTDVNEQPTDMALSNLSVAKHQPSGTAVGDFSTTDPDAGNTFSYTLAVGAGDADNPLFNIRGNTLQTAAVFEYEINHSYSIRVRSTDQGGLLYTEKVFAITVTDANGQPMDIALDNASVAENLPSGAAVGTLSTTDLDAGNTFTYTLVSGTGSTDNASFTISNDTLQTAAAFDYETQNSYSVRVRSTDQGNLYTEKVFVLTVTDVNEQPTDVALSNASVAENQSSGTTVGTLSSTDPDAGNTFTYALVSGTGGTNNASFTLTGNTLSTAAAFDYETNNSYSVRVRSTDQSGLYMDQVLTISVTNVNESPTDMTLSSHALAENQPVGTVVGNCSTTDPDAGNTFTYSFVAGEGSTDNASFTLDGAMLRTAVSFNYEAKNAYNVRLRTTDQDGFYVDKAFTINVLNLLEVTPTTVGMYSPNSSTFYLRNSNTTGIADTTFGYGPASAGWTPLVGDWDNDGNDSIGLYRSSTSTFFLRNNNSAGFADATFIYNPAGVRWIPIVGDWDGDGVDTIGLYSPSTSTFYLRNSNSSGYANVTFCFGPANTSWIPLAGDWDGDGADTIGLYNPSSGVFYLKSINAAGYADMTFAYGPANRGWKPLIGDWDGNGLDTIGLYAPASATYYLKNDNAAGNADVTFTYGPANSSWTPLVGVWTGGEKRQPQQPSSAFQDAHLASLTQSLYADGRISRNDAIQILTSIVSSTSTSGTTVTQSELTDCKMIVADAAVWGMSDYVTVLTSDVVNGNPANAYYQGSALGNLVVGDTATKLNHLVNKWFKGTDHPVATYAYGTSMAGGSLFAGAPSVNDMEQGALGDCYYVAALGSIANVNPTAIQNMFIDNGDNTWGVRFYDHTSGTFVADYVTVDRFFPVSGEYFAYANDFHIYADSSNDLWLPLAEKAYAQWNETGRTGRDVVENTYASIEGGFEADVLMPVLGRGYDAYRCFANDINKESHKLSMINALQLHNPVGMSFLADNNGLYGNHAYVVTNYNAGSDTFTLRNPWGIESPGPLNWDQLWSFGKVFFVANGPYTSWFTGLEAHIPRNSSAKLATNVKNDLSANAVDSLFGSDDSLADYDFVLDAKIGAHPFAQLANVA
jgi:hypothetical protein